MKTHSQQVKQKLMTIINEMSEKSWLFAKNPKKDFTRDRKLSFKTLLTLLLYMGGNSIGNELYEYFDFNVTTATTSAFVQQRQKILPCALEYLMHEFTNSFDHVKTYKGYRLLAVDGSSVSIPHNPNDTDTYFKQGKRKGYNQLHLNAIYDLSNHIYTDVLIQPRRKMNEYDAFAKMVDSSRISQKSIVIADRGYESYNLFAHIEQKGWNYLIRVKDINSNGILSGFDLPSTDEFDVKINIILTKKQTKKEKANPKLFKFVPNNSRFDYLDLDHNKYYPISLRVLRIKVNDELYETIITNLDGDQFSPCDIKELYSLRWGIETSFRKLKYTLGLVNFHSKKIDCITQEIFARLIMYNFSEIIVAHIIVSTKSNKYTYKVNFSLAVLVCKRFISPLSKTRLPDIEALLGKNILPVRIGRHLPRKLNTKSSVSFLYRVA
jgi:hypothetical protein